MPEGFIVASAFQKAEDHSWIQVWLPAPSYYAILTCRLGHWLSRPGKVEYGSERFWRADGRAVS